MKHWVVTRKADGGEVYRYQSETVVEWLGMELATHDHTEYEPEPAPTPAPEPRHITKLAFRQRFTRAEKAGINLVAADNPAAALEQRQLAAALRADLEDQAQALYIDLNRVDTRAGVQALEAYGLIAAGRALQILDAPVLPHEVWHG